jgi:hypothetical protein
MQPWLVTKKMVAGPRQGAARRHPQCKFAELTGCTGSHPPWLCKAFGKVRSKIIEDNKLCPICLLHSAEEVCNSKTYKTNLVCTELECKEQHVKWLHDMLKGLPCLKRSRSARLI